MDTLKEHITRVKPGSRPTRQVKLSETRWVERHDAITFFKEMFVPIYDYLRNTMGEERLNGLAVMKVHRGIPLDIGGVLDRMSKKNRCLGFLL
jgi:hypothetical protein